MIKISNYKFRINASLDTYTTKKEATACLSKVGAKTAGKEKMAFIERSVTVDEFLELAISGHAFCNLFDIDPNKQYWVKNSEGKKYQVYPVYRKGKNKGGMKLTFKSDIFFKGAQAIFVDIDNTRYRTIPEYINCLTYKPTCVYMSFSDNTEKHGVLSRRFRLVYVFDRILNKEEFISVSQSITDHIIVDTAEPMEDDCGTRLSQYMNGVWGNNEVYKTHHIYSPSDFPPEDLVIQSTVHEDERQIVFDDQLLRDMVNMRYEEFMHYYSWKYRYVYRTERPEWIDGVYQLTDEGFLQLWYYREKQTDGQHRRRKLFKNACLRCLMYPDIDADSLLFNLYVDLWRFFDNSDGIITLDVLKRKVKNAMLMNREQLIAYCHFEIEYWAKNRPAFITNPSAFCSPARINHISKKLRWDKLDKRYDRTKSIKENYKNMDDVSLATLYRFCEERGINTNPNKEEFATYKKLSKQEKMKLFEELYDPELSIRENQAIMKEEGLVISVGSIQKWSKILHESDKTKEENKKTDYHLSWWPNSFASNSFM
jgi:hypothetical protein